MKLPTNAYALIGQAIALSNEFKRVLPSLDSLTDWVRLPNSQPKFPKAKRSKRSKLSKPKSRPSRRQRVSKQRKTLLIRRRK